MLVFRYSKVCDRSQVVEECVVRSQSSVEQRTFSSDLPVWEDSMLLLEHMSISGFSLFAVMTHVPFFHEKTETQ